MVNGDPTGLPWRLVALADDANRAVINRLPPTQRAKLIMALLGLVVLGLALVVLIAIGARWYRRTNTSSKASDALNRPDAWASKPLKADDGNDSPSDDDQSDEHENGDGGA